MPACLSTCLPNCKPVFCLSVFLHTCMSVYLFVKLQPDLFSFLWSACLPVCSSVCQFSTSLFCLCLSAACRLVCLSVCSSNYKPVFCLPVFLYACLSVHLRVSFLACFLSVCLSACRPACQPATRLSSLISFISVLPVCLPAYFPFCPELSFLPASPSN